MEQVKFISPQSKFTSELDVSIPAEREEMNCRVFGRDYRRDSNNQPIQQSATDDFAIRNGFAHPDRLDQHCAAVAKTEGVVAAKREADRICKLNAKYKAPLGRWLNLPLPDKVPKEAAI